jgi:sugar O-acyltransferase (sialic acid O-acetyltransferase NeuD family)
MNNILLNRRGLRILGAGGHGRVIADIAETLSFNPVQFIDAAFPNKRKNLVWEIVGVDFSDSSDEFEKFVALGDNRLRLEVLEAMLASSIQAAILIHPGASVSRYASLGAGSVVMAGAVINAGARLGVGVIANSGCTIDHDCILGDGVHISPGANVAGGVTIGRASWVGIGACIRESIEVGANVIVGAGAAVVHDIHDGARVVGIPAK